MRKKYLVYRKDGDGERELVGIFSSGRKAGTAIRGDCSRMREPLPGTVPPGFPFVERTGGVTRFVRSPGREVVYSIETLYEDVEIIK